MYSISGDKTAIKEASTKHSITESPQQIKTVVIGAGAAAAAAEKCISDYLSTSMSLLKN